MYLYTRQYLLVCTSTIHVLNMSCATNCLVACSPQTSYAACQSCLSCAVTGKLSVRGFSCCEILGIPCSKLMLSVFIHYIIVCVQMECKLNAMTSLFAHSFDVASVEFWSRCKESQAWVSVNYVLECVRARERGEEGEGKGEGEGEEERGGSEGERERVGGWRGRGRGRGRERGERGREGESRRMERERERERERKREGGGRHKEGDKKAEGRQRRCCQHKISSLIHLHTQVASRRRNTICVILCGLYI